MKLQMTMISIYEGKTKIIFLSHFGISHARIFDEEIRYSDKEGNRYSKWNG